MTTDSGSGAACRPFFSTIRWTAIVGGIVGGAGTYILLALLGLAAGLTVISSQSIDKVLFGMVVWAGVIAQLAAFMGGFVAARMSGLARGSDGMLHGFVTWGATLILLVLIATAESSVLLSMALTLLGQSARDSASVSLSTGTPTDVGAQRDQVITNPNCAMATIEGARGARDRLQTGNLHAAPKWKMKATGYCQGQVGNLERLIAPLIMTSSAGQKQQRATITVTTLAAWLWWLCIAALVSLIVTMLGGALGIRAESNRTTGNRRL